PPDAGERLAAGPVTHRVLEDGTHTEERLGVLEGHIPPGWAGPPPHIHREHEESFYVLSGAVRFISGGTETVLTAGGFFAAPIGVSHGFGNASESEPARYLLTVSPQRYVGYFRELESLPHGPGGSLDPKEILALMSRYATDPVPPA
ncbi:MAG: cupin domain-containing protein, partial [Acidimicrobiales bacterium]